MARCKDCSECRGNGLDRYGHPCYDCEGTGCRNFPFCGCEIEEDVAPDAQPSSPGPTHTEQESE